MAAVPRTIGLGAKRLGLIVALALSLQPSALAQAKRIISIIPSTTEILFAMGAGDRVAAIGTYDTYPPEAQKLPRVGALIDPNVEQILQMRPDLVVVYSTQTELKRRLERANIPYYDYSHSGVADIFSTIRSLAMRVGVAPAGEALASRLEREMAAIRAKVANRPQPKTLLVFGREPGSLRSIDASGGLGFLHDMLEIAGGADVLGDIRRQSVSVSTELVLSRAPEVIVELRYTAETIKNADLGAWNRLASVPAVKNRRVILLTGEEFVVPGPRVSIAAERLARSIHPEAFK